MSKHYTSLYIAILIYELLKCFKYTEETDGRIIAVFPKIPGAMVYGKDKHEASMKLLKLLHEIKRDRENEN